MKATPQQQAVCDYISKETPGHLIVDARAGTGKTSTIVRAVQDWVQPAIAVAFNKLIANELERRLPKNIMARTINSVGYRAYFETTKIRDPELDTKKPLKIHRELGSLDKFPGLRQAYNVAREWGIAPNGAPADPESVTPDSPETWRRLFDQFGIDTGEEEDPIGAVREMLLRGIRYAWKGYIDFVDQKYMAAIYNWKLPKAPLVLVDERQDLSPIDDKITRMLCAPGGRIVGIGDRYQAIYGFRGADMNAIQTAVEQLNATVLPLTVCFRCPQSVIREAQAYVPDIECGLEAEGQVLHPEELLLDEVPKGSAFLCRNNKPLVQLYFRFIRQGIPAKMRGRDIGQGIVKLLRDTKKHNVGEAVRQMWTTVGKQSILLIDRDMTEAANLLNDKAECAQIIAERVGFDKDLRSFEFECDRMFSDESNGGVILSTIHKAKGLEWRVVHLLDWYLIPNKYVKTEEGLQQERNLQYVGVTRSQETLIFINSDKIK